MVSIIDEEEVLSSDENKVHLDSLKYSLEIDPTEDSEPAPA